MSDHWVTVAENENSEDYLNINYSVGSVLDA
jgi:hypothetical protein